MASIGPIFCTDEARLLKMCMMCSASQEAVQLGGRDFLLSSVEDRDLQDAFEGESNIRWLTWNTDDQKVVSSSGALKGRIYEINGLSDVQSLVKLAASSPAEKETIIIDCRDWSVIPTENLIASFQRQENLELFAFVRSAEAARIMFETLEAGVDGILFHTQSVMEVKTLFNYIRSRLSTEYVENVELAAAKISKIEPIGLGDRACIDLVEMLVPGEGALLGSFARGLFLVHSECLSSEYISSRPFRVNAGAIHSYVLRSSDQTGYLSELCSGQEVQVVNSKGVSRPVLIGRMKIERRPLMLVEALYGEKTYSCILQHAETVRLITSHSGESIPVTELSLGDEVLLCCLPEARHTGIEIEERVVEC